MQNRIFSFDDNAKAAAEFTFRAAGEYLSATYLTRPTIDGDKHDLRHLDGRGVIVWLSPKGAVAKRDSSGFVVR